MEYEVYIANPAGNITVLVKSKVEQSEYIDVALKILNKKDLEAEQVAFISTDTSLVNPRLEMMGLEFCGNATRCFGYLLARNNNVDKVAISASGAKELLEVKVDLKSSNAITKMPLPIRVDKVKIKELNILLPIIIMEGIIHLIIENIECSEENVEIILNVVLNNYDLDAVGLMFVDDERMIPIVYVKNTQSLIYESSCGSGTIAYAYYLSLDKEDGEYHYLIEQPKGILEAFITKENGLITKSLMGGKVEVSKLLKIDI